VAAADVVQAFNTAINAADLARLEALMTEDHCFVDAAGGEVRGRVACADAWREFFGAFPDYRNVFERVRVVVSGEVEAVGRSECSDPRLRGPARWTATVVDGRVRRWQVEER
jgi:ketosteroid isomerase-like protein